MITVMDRIKSMIKYGASVAMTEVQFFEQEIARWKSSPARARQQTGEKYYVGEHDILRRMRTVIGENGLPQEVHNLPNNCVVDNQYAKMVDQKVNYLLGKPLTFDTQDDAYKDALAKLFGKGFQRVLKGLGEDSLNGGIAWLHPYYDEQGELKFKRFPPYEILPFWGDAAHTVLDCALRLYEIEVYEGTRPVKVEKVEIYAKDGVRRYTLQHGRLTPDDDGGTSSYVRIGDKAFNWGRVPLIAFKYNSKELPLISRVKSLQDGINVMLSDFENNMQEDSRNTILVLKNYDGQNLGEFRRNLATYGAVKVKTVDGSEGGLEALTVEVSAGNYKAILDQFKKSLIENARGYDAKDDRLGGAPNQMNIQSMYSDIDLDANGMEVEYQAALEELLWFVDVHLGNGTARQTRELNVIFNRDILINESEAIDNCQKSVGILSMETIVGQHPWTLDIKQELKRLEKEKQEALEQYQDAFPVRPPGDGDGEPT